MTTNPRRVINSTYMSLDGLTGQLQDWHFQYHDEEAAAVALAELEASSDVLMGRKTYESFASAWPTQTGGYADRMNSIPKWVASATLTEAEWNNTTVIEGDLVTQMAKLKKSREPTSTATGSAPSPGACSVPGCRWLRIWLTRSCRGPARQAT